MKGWFQIDASLSVDVLGFFGRRWIEAWRTIEKKRLIPFLPFRHKKSDALIGFPNLASPKKARI